MSYTDLINARVAMNDDEFEDSLEIAAGTDDAEPPVELRPGDPEYDWQAQYPGERVFVYTASTGRTVGLAALEGLRKPPVGVMRKLAKADPLVQVWTVVEWISSEAAMAVSDEFMEDDYTAMYEQWAKWSRTSAGESQR